MKGKLLGDNILIKVEEPKEMKVNGIIIPDSAKEKPQEGTVVLVGPGKTTAEGKVIPMQVKVGDVIVFEKYAGREIKIDDEKYIILNQDGVLLVK